MSSRDDDTTIRGLAVEYWQGGLEDSDRTKIEEYLGEHPDTARFYSHVADVLKAAQNMDLEAEGKAWVAEHGDSVRARLAADLGLDSRHSRVRGSVRAKEPGRAIAGPWGLGVMGRLAVAAAVLLFVGVVAQRFWSRGEEVAKLDGPITPAQLEARSERVSERATPVSVRPEDFADLVAQRDLPETLTLFASQNAVYSLNQHDLAHLEITLEQGLLLGEFVAGGTSRLTIRAPGRELHVVGTVFFVSAERGANRAGVALGEVATMTKVGETAIKARQELTAREQIVPLSEPVMSAIARYIDLEGHEQKLRQAAGRVAAKRVVRPKATPAEPARPSLEEQAYAALTEKRHADAAALFERAIKEKGTAKSRYLMLDLIRLYTSELGRPGAAVGHSRAFLRRWPNDPQAAQIRARLCATLGDRALPTDGCTPK